MKKILKTPLFSLISVMFCSIVLFGCFEKKLTPKDTLIVGLSSEPNQIDPRFAIDAISQRLDLLLFDALVFIDSNLQIKPHLAKEWSVQKDKIYTFLLVNNAKFHDGTPVQAHHVVQTLTQMTTADYGSPLKAGFNNVEKVLATGPLSLEIHLKEPQANFLTDLTLIKALPHYLKDSKKETFKKVLLGSGPYQFVSKKLNTIILKRNPNHFKWQPKFEKIVFKVIKDDSTRALKLKKGELDLVQNALNFDSILKLSQVSSLSITKSPGISYAYLGLNLKDPILKNIKIRQAIAHAINREEIIEHLFHNNATPANSILSSLNWYHERNAKEYAYNPSKAKKLLKQSGIPLPLKLTYKTSTNNQAVNVARIISDQLRNVGIMVEIKTNEWGTFFRDIKNGDSQLFSLRWVGVTDPDIFHMAFHSTNFPPGRNRVFYANTKIDKLLDRGRITVDPQNRKKIYSKIQKQLALDLPYVNLWHYTNTAVYSTRLKGFYFHPQANYMPFIDMWKADRD